MFVCAHQPGLSDLEKENFYDKFCQEVPKIPTSEILVLLSGMEATLELDMSECMTDKAGA